MKITKNKSPNRVFEKKIATEGLYFAHVGIQTLYFLNANAQICMH